MRACVIRHSSTSRKSSRRLKPSGNRLKLSLIIPSWQDGESLRTLLGRLGKISLVTQVVVIEASDCARIEGLARAAGANFIRSEPPSRGRQMNEGAAIATGDVLVFLNADTEISAAHLEALTRAMADTEIIGGAFYRQFDERHPRLHSLEYVARFFTRHGGTLFGDQLVFVRREIFMQLGGFAEIPLMEDVEFSRRLRATGKVAVLDPPVRSSARHHLAKGAWRTTIRNGLFLLFFKAGVPATTLHSIYYGRKNATGDGSAKSLT